MAQELIKRILCDICLTAGERVDGQTYTITTLGKPAEIDLCDVHAKPIIDLAEHVRAPEPTEICPVKDCGRRLQSRPGVRRHLTRTHKITGDDADRLMGAA